MINTFPPLVSGTSLDSQGLQQLNGKEVFASCIIKSGPSDLFFNPTSGLTGFGFNGMRYVNGVLNAGLASWASENSGLTRGGAISFPMNAIALSTEDGLTIFDQSNNMFEVWMAFIQGDLNGFFNNFHPYKTLNTGAMSFSSSAKTMTRSTGSWISDSVVIGSILGLSGGFTNHGRFTVTNVTDLVVTVAETLINAGEFGVTGLAVFTDMVARSIQYSSGVVTIGFLPSYSSAIQTSVYLHIDFIQDQIYGSLSDVLPPATNQDNYFLYMVGDYVVDGYVE